MPSEDPAPAKARRKGGLLHGKVAKLLNLREVALNVGAKDGVVEGMKFNVLNRNAGDILDPDTKEVLGSLTLPKLQIEINFITDEYSVAEVVGTRSGGFGIPSFFFEGSSLRSLTLKRGDHPGVEEIDPKDSIVQVGDVVIEVRSPAEA